MLPWQHVLHNKKVQNILIVALSIVLHVIFLLLLFVWYRDARSYLAICVQSDMAQGAVPIVILPFEKRTSLASVKKNTSAVKPVTKVTKKPAAKTVMVQEKHSKVIPEPIKKSKEQPKPAKLETKKEIKKSDEKKEEIIPAKSIEQKNEPIAQPEQQAETIYIGQDQADLLELQDLIQQEAAIQWRPPVGFSKDLVCVLKILVDWQGAIASVVMEQSSGVLAYDSSARMAVAHMHMPRGAYTKELCITFKQ